jgi:hypothetical protein
MILSPRNSERERLFLMTGYIETVEPHLTNGAPQLQRSAMITVRCFFFAFLMA